MKSSKFIFCPCCGQMLEIFGAEQDININPLPYNLGKYLISQLNKDDANNTKQTTPFASYQNCLNSQQSMSLTDYQNYLNSQVLS